MKHAQYLNFRLILAAIGHILWGTGFLMWIPMLFTLFTGEMNEALAFGASSAITLFSGFLLRMVCRQKNNVPILRKEGFFIVALMWIFVPLAGSLPFLLSQSVSGFSDAFFESMSGFTSTGATIFKNVEAQSRGILLWRSLSQWVGGGGLAMFTIILVKQLRHGAQHLYIAEISGPLKPKFHPKIIQVTREFLGLYLILTVVLFVFLAFGDMNIFDSVCHAMSTISTGGFSTKNIGLACFSTYSQNVIAVFMFFSGINLGLLFLLFSGHPLKLWKDEQFRWYIRIILVYIGILFVGSLALGGKPGGSFQHACFTIISIVSTTGYVIPASVSWGNLLPVILFPLMFMGGCAGSTSGGIKITRVTLLLKYLFSQFKKQLHPRAIIPVKNDGVILRPEVLNTVFAFFFMYILFAMAGGFLLTLCGEGMRTALSLSAASLGNIGPAVVNLCPECNFTDLISIEKWILSILMLAGRLEVFAIVALFSPSFWKS